jgi:hypothetical protein
MYGNFLYSLIYVLFSGIEMNLPEGKRLLGRPRRRWVDNIKIDLRKRG